MGVSCSRARCGTRPRPARSTEPFWCTTTPGDALSVADCEVLSAQLDFGLAFAHNHFRASSATAAGAVSTPYEAGVGAAFHFTEPRTSFDYRRPDTLRYDGTGSDAQVVAIEWNVFSASAPAGFRGGNDVWHEDGPGTWQLHVWLLRPFQNEVNVFAATHPCLTGGGPIYDVTDDCYTETHINPFKILVTNDDGYGAAGIDAAVEALSLLPIPVDITVSAPLVNQSGTGEMTSPGPLTADLLETVSHHPRGRSTVFRPTR